MVAPYIDLLESLLIAPNSPQITFTCQGKIFTKKKKKKRGYCFFNCRQGLYMYICRVEYKKYFCYRDKKSFTF